MIDAQGNVVWEADIKPFGQAAVNTGAVANHFRFAGQYFDEETGLHYNYHRYYDPSLGRYVTLDPIGLAGGINLFAYSLNNPVIYIDQFGLEVFGINTGGSYFLGAGGGASSALLIQSDGKTNRVGFVTTQDVGGGYGKGLFTHVVYGQPGNTIEGYANTAVSNSGSIGYASYSWTFGDQGRPFYEAGVSLIPGESVSLTKTTGQVIFALEYSFGAADNFYGEWLYDHRLNILDTVFGGVGEDIYDWFHSCE